jgi:C-terminal processing protease CtpA/Prc
MKKIINMGMCSFLVFLLLWTTGCESQYLGGNRNSKWIKDLNYLQEALYKKHANLFFKVSEEQFNNQINELKKSIDNLNDDEITDEIYKIVASVGDGHTKVEREFSRSYPFQFYYFKDSIYAINTIDEYKEALNCELVKINGQDVNVIKNKISPLISRENDVTIKKVLPNYLFRPEILHGVKIIEDIDASIIFTFKDKSGKAFDLQVEALNTTLDNGEKFIISREYDETYPLYMQKADLKYWYQYLGKDKVLYLKYNACSEDEKVGRLEDFNNEVLSFMQNNQVDKFVIDMRNNSGGGENRLNEIIEGIKNSNLNDKKRFFVIVGRPTFSAAIIDAVKWRNETNATFIGEPTSGKPNHYGAVKNFSLPNSNLKIQYSTTYAKTSNDERDSFIPDKTMELSIDDYVNKKDPVLDYIIGEN